LLRPDGSIQFFTPTGIAVGSAGDVRTFRPIAAGLPLASPFSVTVPNFYAHQWTAADPKGSYVFFVAALRAGTAASGSVPNDAIYGLMFTSFTVQ
jgi:hypothetical protein